MVFNPSMIVLSLVPIMIRVIIIIIIIIIIVIIIVIVTFFNVFKIRVFLVKKPRQVRRGPPFINIKNIITN
jgi:hypothetical protein